MKEADDDLRDVFRLLYADDDAADWAFSDDEETQSTNVDSSRAEVDEVVEDVIGTISKKYTKKRFLDALDSLLAPPAEKKRRIYPSAPSLALAISNSTIPSSVPLPVLPSTTVYAPFSPLPLLARLRSFAIYSFPDLDQPIDATSLALGGWTCISRTEVHCPICVRKVDFGTLMDIKDHHVRLEVAKRLGVAMRGNHSPQCPWNIKSCPDDLMIRLRRMIHPQVSSSLIALARRLQIDCLPDDTVRWSCPLSNTQLNALCANFKRHTAATTDDIKPLNAAMAFFAWYPYHPNGISTHVEPTAPPQPTQIVHCRACQRRVGLWSFKASEGSSEAKVDRKFDLVKEHLSWCPIRQGEWWTSSMLVNPSAVKQPFPENKGWLSVSEKLEKKKWRR